ncbi:hypothetical protein ITP53_22980 [Nonomuraea sp. K274]|uniref:Uncharacterized protein n=1 Tax=Nonomuraea cypriaca TaxID=1187855 RepID=A0A931AG22_9ACTN|nr:hypothetical protein [Nonomuraea cypriaca]MBF8188537.1 hypothetical protein [Nonomuraea cypriaca]
MGYPPSGQAPGYRRPPPGYPPAQPLRRGAGRVVAGVLVAGFGLLSTLVGGGLIAQAISNANQEITNKEFVRNLWRNLPVETIFPATIGLRDPDHPGQSGDRGWTRAAVSSDTSCGEALTGGLAREARERGCQAAIRATYVDDTGGTAATVVIVAFGAPDADDDLDVILQDAQQEERDFGIRALPVSGARWRDNARAGSGGHSVWHPSATLFVAVTSGPADGRLAGRLPEPWGRSVTDQRADRSPWGETAKGMAKSTAAHLAAEIEKVRE